MNIQILLFSAVVIMGMATSKADKKENYLQHCRTSELYNSTLKDCSVEVLGQNNMTVYELHEFGLKNLSDSQKDEFTDCAEKRVEFTYFGNLTAHDIDRVLALIEVDKEEILQELRSAAEKCIVENEGGSKKVIKCIIQVAKKICK